VTVAQALTTLANETGYNAEEIQALLVAFGDKVEGERVWVQLARMKIRGMKFNVDAHIENGSTKRINIEAKISELSPVLTGRLDKA